VPFPPIPPAGAYGAGFFVPQTFVDPVGPPAILTPAVDYRTAEYVSLTRGVDPIDDQVQIALTRVRLSGASVTNDGQRFLDTGKLDAQAERSLESEAKRALRRLTSNGDITVTRIDASLFPADQAAEIQVDYVNLRAKDKNEPRKALVRLTSGRPEAAALAGLQRLFEAT